VRPGVPMISRYADDGQVCEMTLEKRSSFAPKEEPLSASISASLWSASSTRGQRTGSSTPSSRDSTGNEKVRVLRVFTQAA
jgi:hypothetical protein